MKQKKTQTFNNGLVKIYKVDNIANPGDMPKEGITLKTQKGLRYEDRTVGMNRYWTAKQNQVQIEKVIRVPRVDIISPQDIAIPNNGKQYEIVQCQNINDTEPPSIDLSLERLDENYDID